MAKWSIKFAGKQNIENKLLYYTICRNYLVGKIETGAFISDDNFSRKDEKPVPRKMKIKEPKKCLS